MILAYAGRRAQSLAGNEDTVRTRIRRLVAALEPTAVVGAAADGADLLVLEAVLAHSPATAVHLVLPTRQDVFVQDSVETGWRERFDAVVQEVARRHGTLRTLDLDPGEVAYREANRVVVEQAGALAVDGQRAAVLAVAAQGEGQMVTDLVQRGALAGMPALRIDPTVVLADRPTCFVAMPFGEKPDPQRNITVNCEAVYRKILTPALEHAQLAYHRADEQIDSGVVLEPMIEALAEADVVIADLGTGNFNVGWELGLRHLLRDRRTLLVGPAEVTAPFDVAAVRRVVYRNDQTGISDDAAVDAWRALAPFLADADSADNDSPVASTMEVQQWGVVRRRTRRDERWEALRQQLALARDLKDPDLMREVVEEAESLVAPGQRQLLRAEAGVGLVRLGAFADARPLLREIVEGDPQVLRPEAHLYYAQSLYRPPGASPADLGGAERVLRRVLVKRPAHPEVRALLGAVTKRRLRHAPDPGAERADLDAALGYYRHDVERDLNRYYEGINAVALGVVLAVRHRDPQAADRARTLLPAVRVAAQMASDRAEERYWALATVAECALHEQVLTGGDDVTAVRAAYRDAGRCRPLPGDLASTLDQLSFLERLGLPVHPLEAARRGLREGAGGA